MTTTLNCKGRLLYISQPVVMGILNATPDSFYTKGRERSTDALLELAGKMLEEGATILDIGGLSTRPKAPALSAAEELQRVLPVIASVKENFPRSFISVDTYRAEVAARAVAAGADIVNDISAGLMDPEMLRVTAALKVPYIAMHMQGTPADMQDNPTYDNVVLEVLHYFKERLQACVEQGISDVILDPGFGFGKTIDHNYSLLKGMHSLRMLRKPLLAGISRKSMVYRPLGTDARHALNGTTALHMLALRQGAHILRVHDVKPAMECITLFRHYRDTE